MVWLSQALIAELFQKDVRTIKEQLVTIYGEGELGPDSTNPKFRIVAFEGSPGVAREIEYFRLPTFLGGGGERPQSRSHDLCEIDGIERDKGRGWLEKFASAV